MECLGRRQSKPHEITSKTNQWRKNATDIGNKFLIDFIESGIRNLELNKHVPNVNFSRLYSAK
jgi:hypothetical protein